MSYNTRAEIRDRMITIDRDNFSGAADDTGLACSIGAGSGYRSELRYPNSGTCKVSFLFLVCRAAIPSISWNKVGVFSEKKLKICKSYQ